MNSYWYDTRFPAIDDLRNRARRRIPGFAFEYLDGGCNEDVNLAKNTREIRALELRPRYLDPAPSIDLTTELFGHRYAAPFGIAPIGLQGIIWPDSAEILARAALQHDIPFILSTVSTLAIETASELTEGRAWFQLYHPAEEALKLKLLERASAAGCPVLVALCDVPVFGFRPRDIRNGLAMPPRMTLRNLLQIAAHPNWALRTLLHGQPTFRTLQPYIPRGADMRRLGEFMDQTFSGRMTADRLARLRDQWQGTLVLKGVATEEDAELAIRTGVDGIIVSNHGGRQLDAGQSTIVPLRQIAARFSDQTRVMMDSGIRSGPDIARSLAAGAAFTFLGRSFMYSVAALGSRGGEHMIGLLKTQLEQLLGQVCCSSPADLHRHLVTAPGDAKPD